MARDGYKRRRGSGLPGLLDAVRRSESRHPPLDDGYSIDPDHCQLCNQVFHEHRQESARWRKQQDEGHEPQWPLWEERVRSIHRDRENLESN